MKLRKYEATSICAQVLTILLGLTVSFGALAGEEVSKLLKDANQAFEADEKDLAKELYLKATKLGSAEAHFQLTYKFILPPDERKFHQMEAAKAGHGKGLESLLDSLLFRAETLKNADPLKALEIYNTAKKNNPKLEFFGHEGEYRIVKKCAEAGPLNVGKFKKQYGIKTDESGSYFVWQLAEEASQRGRFGKPDPLFTLKLICRGGIVPFEFSYAVNDFYAHWKNNKVATFDICDYAASGMGLAFCSGRAEEEGNKKRAEELKIIKRKIGTKNAKLLEDAYLAACNFIEKKAWNEEGHDGSGYIAWARNSIAEQKESFVEIVEQVKARKLVPPESKLTEADKRLNKNYRKVIRELSKKPISGMRFTIEADDLKEVQRLWIPYRDASAKLFHSLNESISVDRWKSWLTDIRSKELEKIPELRY